MESMQQDLNNIGIGTKEQKKLEPATVEVQNVSVVTVGEKGAKKVEAQVKHPQSELPVMISAAKVEMNKGQLTTSGLWFNQDDDGLIRKNSALAKFLSHLGCASVGELKGRSIPTMEDDNGYLVFKGY